jgi:hypothetical protein
VASTEGLCPQLQVVLVRHRAVRHGSRMTAQAGAVIEARPAAVAGGGVDDSGSIACQRPKVGNTL